MAQYFIPPGQRTAFGVVNVIIGIGLFQAAPLPGRIFFGVGLAMIGSAIRQGTKQVVF